MIETPLSSEEMQHHLALSPFIAFLNMTIKLPTVIVTAREFLTRVGRLP